MKDDDKLLPSHQFLNPSASHVEMQQLIRQLQARQIELEAENHALRQVQAERETALHSILTASQDVIYRYRFWPEPGFDYVSPSVTALVGYTPEEHYADPALGTRIVHPDDRRLLEQIADGIDSCDLLRFIIRWMHKDGDIVHTEHRCNFIRNAAGRVVAYEGIARDISAQIEVQTQQQHLTTVLANIPGAVISVDAELHILSWNAAAEQMYGWQAGDVLGRPLGDVLGTCCGATHAATWKSLAEAGNWHGELEQQHRTGRKIRVRAAITGLHGAGGELAGAVYISHDITAEHRAEEALVNSERLFRSLIEHASDGILLVGLNRQLHYASPSAARILGDALAELMQPSAIVVHPDDRALLEASWLKIFTTPEQTFHQSYRVLHRDQSWHWIEAAMTNRLHDPAVQAVVVNFRDVTEHKLAEYELTASNARFKSLFENMPLGVLYQEIDGRVTLANCAAEQILGLSHDQLMGRVSLDPCGEAVREDGTIFPGDEHPAMVASHTGKSVTDVLMGIYHPLKEEQRWLRIAAVPEFHPGESTPYRVFSIFDDITERRQIEHATAEAEQIYRTTILAAGALPYRYDYESESYIFLPVEAEQLTGYSLEELTPALLQSIVLEWIPRGEYAGLPFAEAVARARSGQSNSVWQCDFRVRTRSGAERWLADRAVQITNEQGRVTTAIGILLDVTERVHAEAMVRASEERYRRLAEELEVRVAERTAKVSELYARLDFLLLHTPAIIYTATLCEHGITTTFLSESTYRLLGYPPEEHRANPGFWTSLLHPEDAASQAEFFTQLLATGSALWEHRVRHANGDYRWHTTRMNRLQSDTDPAPFIGYSVDIHERKLALDALRISEARYRSVLNNAPASITEIDRNGTILSQNRALLERPIDTVIGQTLFAVAPPAAAEAIRNALHAIFEEGQNVHYESSIEVAPGNVRHLVSYAGPIENERIEAAVIATVDITDRKAAEAELQRQRDFARQVMDTMGEGLIVSDRSQRAEYVNLCMAQMLEFSPADLLGRTMADFVAAEDLPKLVEILTEHQPKGIYQSELGIRTRSGRIVPTLVSSTPRRVNGELVGQIVLFTDLTRIKQIESDLRRSSDEMRTTNVALEQAMRMKDEFLASMSHELRTPLTGILGLSEALQLQTAGPLTERQLRSVKYIWESGQHLLDLINDILDLSKLSAHQLELDQAACPVNQVCEASLTLVRGMAVKKSQSIAFEIEPEEIVLYADARRLKQMLVNLLSNAIKFTPKGGILGLSVRGDRTRQVVEFCVWDKGIGIAAEDLSKIFEAFTQLDSSLTRQHSGSGLGLALVQQMAHLHGGTVKVSSKPGVGSEFTLVLPWRNAQEVRPAQQFAPGATVTAVPDQPDALQGERQRLGRLLVAEDDPINANILCELLTEQGYSVAVASHGLEALHMVSTFMPELILMDIRMPHMNGFEAIRRLRAHADPKVAAIPIVALTAQAMENDAERCLAAGASTYLVKPFNIHALLTTIAEQLAGKDESSNLTS